MQWVDSHREQISGRIGNRNYIEKYIETTVINKNGINVRLRDHCWTVWFFQRSKCNTYRKYQLPIWCKMDKIWITMLFMVHSWTMCLASPSHCKGRDVAVYDKKYKMAVQYLYVWWEPKWCFSVYHVLCTLFESIIKQKYHCWRRHDQMGWCRKEIAGSECQRETSFSSPRDDASICGN